MRIFHYKSWADCTLHEYKQTESYEGEDRIFLNKKPAKTAIPSSDTVRKKQNKPDMFTQ